VVGRFVRKLVERVGHGNHPRANRDLLTSETAVVAATIHALVMRRDNWYQWLERRRTGDAISSAFVESAVNQVVSKRMVKKQQMRWTPRGAHLLLQVRTRVLNDDLAPDFQRWYPSFDTPTRSADMALAA